MLRSDVERKALFHKQKFDSLGADGYRPQVTVRVYAALADKARRALAAGHSVIVDAVFARPDERVQIEDAARSAAVDLEGLFLEADVATRAQRVTSRERDASDADAAVARAQEQYDLGALSWRRLDASGSPEKTLNRAKTALGFANP